MSNKPEALLLADALLGCAGPLLPILPAATELRRQHAEIESAHRAQREAENELSRALARHAMAETALKAECDALRAELREVTEAMNDPAVNNIRTLAESIRILQAERDALRAALKDIADDYEDRFDMNDPSTNPGIKHVVREARAALKEAVE